MTAITNDWKLTNAEAHDESISIDPFVRVWRCDPGYDSQAETLGGDLENGASSLDNTKPWHFPLFPPIVSSALLNSIAAHQRKHPPASFPGYTLESLSNAPSPSASDRLFPRLRIRALSISRRNVTGGTSTSRLEPEPVMSEIRLHHDYEYFAKVYSDEVEAVVKHQMEDPERHSMPPWDTSVDHEPINKGGTAFQITRDAIKETWHVAFPRQMRGEWLEELKTCLMSGGKGVTEVTWTFWDKGPV